MKACSMGLAIRLRGIARLVAGGWPSGRLAARQARWAEPFSMTRNISPGSGLQDNV
jgi:hypothetical protein